MPGTQKLVDPQGQLREVPDEQAGAALSSGWRTPTSEDTAAASTAAANEQDFGGIGGGLKAAGYGALRGATLGISDPLLEAAGVSASHLRGLQEQHPIVSTGSELAGAVLPSLMLPESLAARTPAGAVSSIGRDIIEHASREGAGLLERAAIHSTAAAAEGAFYGGGQYLSDLALGNQQLSAEGFIGSVGKGALFSAPIGGAFTLGEGALIRARSLFPRNQVSEAVANGVDKEAKSALTSAIGDGDQMADKVRQQIELNDANKGMAQAGEGTTRRMFGEPDQASIINQVAAGADSAQLGEALHAYETSRTQLVDWLHTEADPDLTAALEKLSPIGVQSDEIVPRGEFGEPGKGGIKSQDELARAAADTSGDASAPQSQSSLDETRAGKPGMAKGTPVGPVPEPIPTLEPLADIRDRLETMPIKDLEAERIAADRAATDAKKRGLPNAEAFAQRSLDIDSIYFRRSSVENDIAAVLAESSRLGELPDYRSGPGDGGIEDELFVSRSTLKEQRDALESAVHGEPESVMAVSDSGGGLDRAIKLNKSGDGFTSSDGGRWKIAGSTAPFPAHLPVGGIRLGSSPDVFSRHLERRMSRIMGSNLPETRIGYIDGRAHLFEKVQTAAERAAAGTDASTNPLIQAWVKDVSSPAVMSGSGGGSGMGYNVARTVAGMGHDEAREAIADLAATYKRNEGKLIDAVASAGLTLQASNRIRDAAREQIQWLVDWAETSRSVASAIGGETAHQDHNEPSSGGGGGGDDLEALLRGTKAKLDSGESLRSISDNSSSRASYVTNKAELRARQANEYRARAVENRADIPDVLDAIRWPEQPQAGHYGDLRSLAAEVASKPEPHIGAPETKVDSAVKMRMRIAEREGGIDKALGKTIVDHNMRENVQRMTDDEAIAKLLGQRVGKDVNMGQSMGRAAKAIGDFESASADLVDMLGSDAPPGAVERARGYRGATASHADGVAASTARTAEGMQDAFGPGGKASDATSVDDDISRALRKHDAQQAKRAAGVAPMETVPAETTSVDDEITRALRSHDAQEAERAARSAQRHRLSKKVDAVQESARPTKATGEGILGKATKAGAALEVLKALGIHVPALSAIPVIGPLLGLFLKAKAVMGIIGRKGGSVDSTIEGVIASRSAAVQDRITKATTQLLETGAKVAGKASDASAGAATVLQHKLFPGGQDSKSKDPVALFHARMDDISRAMAPQAVNQAIADRIQTADPRLQDTIAAQYQRAMQFLYSKAPHEVVLPGMLPGDGKWQPSKAQLNEWAKYVHYVSDPASVLEDLAKGIVTLEGAETLRVVYPQLYALAQQTLIKSAPEMQATLPYTKRIAMSIMFGVPIDGTLTASHMSFLQSPSPNGGGGSAPSAAPSPPTAQPGAPGLVGPVNIGKQTMTSLDRRAGG